MRSPLILFFICFTQFCSAQQIVNVVMVGDKGITQNIKKAKYFIAIKNYGDTIFERLEYKIDGPLMKVISYKDSLITIKNGRYVQYEIDGWVSSEGNYADNKKNGSWIVYGKNGKAKFEYKYKDDQLIESIDIDSSDKVNKNKPLDPQDVEAKFIGGERAYTKLITDKMTEALNAGKLSQGGSIRVRFVVTTTGKMEDLYLTRSANYLFDEACLSMMRSIHDNWVPATQHGKVVRAYREQPLTFTIR